MPVNNNIVKGLKDRTLGLKERILDDLAKAKNDLIITLKHKKTKQN